MPCYREGGCGPHEDYSCSECPANKPEYKKRTVTVARTETLEEARAAGMKEAWEIARRIAMPVKNGGLKIDELKIIFGDIALADIFAKYTVEEAKALIKRYELTQLGIGTIVKHSNGMAGVVIKKIEHGNGIYLYTVLWSDFSVGTYQHDYFQKTDKLIDVSDFQKRIKA